MNNFMIDPYFFGLWLGDGDSDAVRITTADIEIEDFLKEYATSLGLKTWKGTKPNTKAVRIGISAESSSFGSRKVTAYKEEFKQTFSSIKEAAEVLNIKSSSSISHNITGKYKHVEGYTFKYEEREYVNLLRRFFIGKNLFNNKNIPEWVYQEDEDFRFKLLAGIVDSDGTKYSNRRLSISTKLISLAEDYCKLAQSLDINSRIDKRVIKYVDKEYYHHYAVILFNSNVCRIPTLLERKKIREYES